MTNAEARFSKSLRPRKPEGSLGRTAQDVHLDSHTAPELGGGRELLGRLLVNTMPICHVSVKAQELCGSRGGRPELHVPNSPYGLCGRRKATLNLNSMLVIGEI